jgi:asparagine synthase (glutamine-hydrolysing)
MCGILGVVARPGRFDESQLCAAVSSLAHRGPDSSAVERVFGNDQWEVWFGHTRLSILDLSDAGKQPMWGEIADKQSGCLVFNGELYNHDTLRTELSPYYQFRTRSDTEVLLAGLLVEGTDFLKKSNAMLSLALLPPSKSQLLLARDRLGKKPLFVYESDGVFAFASELKAFHALGLSLTQDERGWAYYQWLRYIPWAGTCYKECRKFPAASFATLDLRKDHIQLSPPELFWNPLEACGSVFQGTYEDALEEFSYLLDDSTKIRLHADVPVGLFLSGGIDSSLVASSVSRQHGNEVVAYIVKAAAREFDESERALATAKALGLPTEVIDLRVEDYHRQIEKVAYHYDDPCSSLSQLAVMAMSEAAAKRVTVVLTGDGGDEVFLGYPWLSFPERLWSYRKRIDRIPGFNSLAQFFLNSQFGSVGLYLFSKLLGYNPATLEAKRWMALDALRRHHPQELYEHFQCLTPRGALSQGERSLLGDQPLWRLARAAFPEYGWELSERRDIKEQLACQEMVTGMRDEILVKVERATMAYGLEARSPLLDYRIVEFGMSLPLHYKVQQGVYKRILRDSCAQRLGADLASLKKSGFGIPVPEGLPPGCSPGERWNNGFREHWDRTWCGTTTRTTSSKGPAG